jgi:hypothetical protein
MFGDLCQTAEAVQEIENFALGRPMAEKMSLGIVVHLNQCRTCWRRHERQIRVRETLLAKGRYPIDADIDLAVYRLILVDSFLDKRGQLRAAKRLEIRREKSFAVQAEEDRAMEMRDGLLRWSGDDGSDDEGTTEWASDDSDDWFSGEDPDESECDESDDLLPPDAVMSQDDMTESDWEEFNKSAEERRKEDEEDEIWFGRYMLWD